MSALVNGVRGETVIDIDGQPHALCLTLGALAQLETAFGVNGPAAVARRLASLSAQDTLIVLEALLQGGGNPIDRQTLRSLKVSPSQAAKAVAAAFSAVHEGAGHND